LSHSKSLPDFVSNQLNSLAKKPLLLSVQQLSPISPFAGSVTSSEEDVLVLVCAANYDLQVLLKLGSIDLLGGARLHFRKQHPIIIDRSPEQARASPREVYIIW
jgi:hypothetical protein